MKTTSKQLIAEFEDLFQIEKRARDFYGNILLQEIPDHDRKVIQGIHYDEEGHMKIVSGLIDLIKSNESTEEAK